MRAAAALQPRGRSAWWEMADARHQAAGWPLAEPEEHDDGDAAAGVLSGEYQALETSTLVSALAHVVSGGGDGYYTPWAGGARGNNNPPAAMAAPASGTAHGYGYSAAAAPTPAHFVEAGRPRSRVFKSGLIRLFFYSKQYFSFINFFSILSNHLNSSRIQTSEQTRSSRWPLLFFFF